MSILALYLIDNQDKDNDFIVSKHLSFPSSTVKNNSRAADPNVSVLEGRKLWSYGHQV